MTNFGWYLQDDYDTLEEAKKKALNGGYDVQIVHYNWATKEATQICSYSPLYGFRVNLT
jgi:hypothetical protein